MSAQQIRLNINELVNGIEDEFLLDACYQALEGIAKAYQRGVSKINGKGKHPKTGQKKGLNNDISTKIMGKEEPLVDVEKMIPHDLSLVFLANEVFKGSQPLPEAGEIAFDKAFIKSLKKEPTLPNRL